MNAEKYEKNSCVNSYVAKDFMASSYHLGL